MEEVSVLIQKAQAGDSCARDVLIEKNLGLVHHIVKRFAGRGYEMEDLFQTGTIGLMKAIDHFDLSYDVKFSTYAVPLIAGEIRRFLRDDGMVKVSRTLKDTACKLHQASSAFLAEWGREPTIRELCEKAGVSYEDAVMAIGASGEVESIEKTVYEGDGKQIRLLDKVASRPEDGQWEDSEKNRLLDRMLLQQLMDGLTEEERTLITLRYYEDKTQTQIAKELGISQVQVSRLEKRILIRMRKCAGDCSC
ncbi:MAG TPA: SigB/SigF/SigG family RNA polymerase sigma factor [Candidatus Eisenbergiella pullicola]|nr:SigB/SigF/SigG family RNA polymerase sigma factor [Candidatus Eisenbergiella pullicola]